MNSSLYLKSLRNGSQYIQVVKLWYRFQMQLCISIKYQTEMHLVSILYYILGYHYFNVINYLVKYKYFSKILYLNQCKQYICVIQLQNLKKVIRLNSFSRILENQVLQQQKMYIYVYVFEMFVSENQLICHKIKNQQHNCNYYNMYCLRGYLNQQHCQRRMYKKPIKFIFLFKKVYIQTIFKFILTHDVQILFCAYVLYNPDYMWQNMLARLVTSLLFYYLPLLFMHIQTSCMELYLVVIAYGKNLYNIFMLKLLLQSMGQMVACNIKQQINI
eukprot:TRINITY_DN5805_c0_g1_i8.p1 TRINITY_DN5805_c0_g1~~TRINITY_DN5805_c0_g1_i8.p1  ORF type:complete len:273 (-),score=-23.54 TRINITY_DN5805_c0_g1_i8:377-1195(-)